ncbi:MAG: cytochrome ubiquinol oxidase subunit I [Chloroflexi bacterium]|nr:MAG: cytochrome ubiquinol oxidase subunit I [Chloroflexota bacterium]MBL1196455.1 cytochrome ubiquinol oxidase subunit I [Chloroflexota bacterium]NOH13750.1 cytochrome ubiquinol oxidase subunit I [Chloroflexota bacterium]
MDLVLLARLQFASTTIYHFFFVPLTLGLSILIAVMQTIYWRTGQPVYKQMAKFWGKLFLINFAMGVVTGIVQEFQFGMNWSEYSRYVGDIFGAPLAIEALMAFFIESTFLGVWIFGWDRLSKGVHLASIWLVAIAANISALWILIANSFMQQPVGFELNPVTGRAEMVDFLALILNPNIWVQYPHVVLAGLSTGAFFIMGISALHILRKSNVDFFKRSFQIGAVFGFVSILLVALNGHSQAQHMVEIQPMKMAAAEALWQDEDPASFSILTIGDLTQRRDVFSIRLPRLLSLLSYNQLDGEVRGIHSLQAEYEETYGPGNYIPPVAITYWSFRAMVGAGFVMLALGAYALYMLLGNMQDISPRMMRLFVWAIFLPYIANSTGWLLAEVGRAPWAVQGLLLIEDSISPNVGAGALLTSLIGYVLLYGVLLVADVYLLRKYALAGPQPIEEEGVAKSPQPQAEPSLVAGQN